VTIVGRCRAQSQLATLYRLPFFRRDSFFFRFSAAAAARVVARYSTSVHAAAVARLMAKRHCAARWKRCDLS